MIVDVKLYLFTFFKSFLIAPLIFNLNLCDQNAWWMIILFLIKFDLIWNASHWKPFCGLDNLLQRGQSRRLGPKFYVCDVLGKSIILLVVKHTHWSQDENRLTNMKWMSFFVLFYFHFFMSLIRSGGLKWTGGVEIKCLAKKRNPL